MTVRTSAGTLLQVNAGAPASHDAAGFGALAWVNLGEVVDLGEFGRAYNLVTHNPLATRSTQKLKGSYNEGAIPLQLGLDTDDAGQIIMKAAVNNDNAISFKVTTQNGDVYYFRALVMSFVVGIGSVDQVTGATASLEITSSATGVGVVEVLS